MSNNKNSTTQAASDLPPKPKEPDPYECCERGCDPCVYDYYAKSLARWEKRVAEIENQKKIMANKALKK